MKTACKIVFIISLAISAICCLSCFLGGAPEPIIGNQSTDSGNMNGSIEYPDIPDVPDSPDTPDDSDEDIEDDSSSTSIKFILPVIKPRIIKDYNDKEMVYNEFLHQWYSHQGIYMMTQNSSIVFAVQNGIIASVQTTSFGENIYINHDGGFVSRYLILNGSVLASVGSSVRIADPIATLQQDQSGCYYLYFELYKNGVKVDPANYISFYNI